MEEVYLKMPSRIEAKIYKSKLQFATGLLLQSVVGGKEGIKTVNIVIEIDKVPLPF